MPPERRVPGTAAEWLRHARSDLALARVVRPAAVLPESLCFHAQQAAEKALKAVLLSRAVAIPKTHSIGMLLDILRDHLPIPHEIDDAAVLTDYAVWGRYPGDVEPVEEEEYSAAIRLAESVFEWAEQHVSTDR